MTRTITYPPRRLRFLFALVLMAFFIGCSSTNPAFDTLHDKGIVPVSPTNPFVGSNLFLAREMEQSNSFYRFIRERGAPQAIEITGSSEKNAELRLLYADKQEAYNASSKIASDSGSKEWIVRGPYAIDRMAYKQVAWMKPNEGAVFEIFGRRQVIGAPAQAAETRVILPAYIPPEPTPLPKPRKALKSPSKKEVKQVAPEKKAGVESAETPTSSAPTNFDQQALAEVKGKTPPTSKPQTKGPSIEVGKGESSSHPPQNDKKNHSGHETTHSSHSSVASSSSAAATAGSDHH